MLVGDSGGMVNPFNGEGIAYAVEAGEVAAAVVADALRARSVPRREAVLRTYADRMDDLWGSYYRMGGIFSHLIGKPTVMRLCTEHGLKRPALMRVVLKLLANLTDRPGRDTADRIVNGMRIVTPSLGRAHVRLASFTERRV
jgi:flavin-dependent dehydrogenase